MLVFIDDSGDAGFKIDSGSSRYFVIALVIFDDELEAEKTAVAIKELRRELHFPEQVEFKFFKSKHSVRERFLRTIAPFQFRVRCLVVDKTRIRSAELKRNKDSFYSYCIKVVLKHSDSSILDAKVKIDGSGDRIFRRSFLTYLRKQLATQEQKIMRHCRLVDSQSNVLIQMADMIAGTVRRSYDVDKKDGIQLKGIIMHRIQDEWQFQ